MQNQVIKKLLALTLSFLMLLSLTGNVSADNKKLKNEGLNGHWAERTMKKWAQDGLLKGDEDGEINPDSNVTRVEFMAFINRSMGLVNKSDKVNNYTDVPSDAWYKDEVAKALAAGYIKGVSEEKMDPLAPITNEQAYAILARISHVQGKMELTAVKDNAEISTWAKDSIQKVIANGYVSGYDQKISPKNYTSRAQVITLLERFRSNERIFAFPGTYSVGFANRVTVLSNDVVIQDTVIAKNLIYGKGVTKVETNNVKVKGKVIQKETPKEDTKEKTKAEAEKKIVIKDGFYKGIANAYGGEIIIEIYVKDGQITDVEIVEHKETVIPDYLGMADDVIREILDTGNADDIDAVTGATITSKGIIYAVNDAFSQAKGLTKRMGESEWANKKNSHDEEEDAGSGGSSSGSHGSGSSSSHSQAAVNSVDFKDINLVDGVYTGEAVDYSTNLGVQVTVQNKKVTKIEVIKKSQDVEDKLYQDLVFPNKLDKTIIYKQSTNVDAISRATTTSKALLAAVENALNIKSDVVIKNIVIKDKSLNQVLGEQAIVGDATVIVIPKRYENKSASYANTNLEFKVYDKFNELVNLSADSKFIDKNNKLFIEFYYGKNNKKHLVEFKYEDNAEDQLLRAKLQAELEQFIISDTIKDGDYTAKGIGFTGTDKVKTTINIANQNVNNIQVDTDGTFGVDGVEYVEKSKKVVPFFTKDDKSEQALNLAIMCVHSKYTHAIKKAGTSSSLDNKACYEKAKELLGEELIKQSEQSLGVEWSKLDTHDMQARVASISTLVKKHIQKYYDAKDMFDAVSGATMTTGGVANATYNAKVLAKKAMADSDISGLSVVYPAIGALYQDFNKNLSLTDMDDNELTVKLSKKDGTSLNVTYDDFSSNGIKFYEKKSKQNITKGMNLSDLGTDRAYTAVLEHLVTGKKAEFQIKHRLGFSTDWVSKIEYKIEGEDWVEIEHPAMASSSVMEPWRKYSIDYTQVVAIDQPFSSYQGKKVVARVTTKLGTVFNLDKNEVIIKDGEKVKFKPQTGYDAINSNLNYFYGITFTFKQVVPEAVPSKIIILSSNFEPITTVELQDGVNEYQDIEVDKQYKNAQSGFLYEVLDEDDNPISIEDTDIVKSLLTDSVKIYKNSTHTVDNLIANISFKFVEKNSGQTEPKVVCIEGYLNGVDRAWIYVDNPSYTMAMGKENSDQFTFKAFSGDTYGLNSTQKAAIEIQNVYIEWDKATSTVTVWKTSQKQHKLAEATIQDKQWM